jgi:beta-glucosidase
MNKDFLWGGATASYQCEGSWNTDGKVESMWDAYLHDKNLENGDIASDHYNRYKEDIRLMKEGGHNSYRFSLSWPRIIKNLEGDVNEKGLEFYNSLIDECHKNNIEPYVTIYHWDLPQYLQEKGGWLNIETCFAYLKFVTVVLNRFKDKVKYWVTFNEPRWFVFNGYFIGNYPPEMHSAQDTIHAAYNVMYANALAVKFFREGKFPGKIGIVHSYTPVDGVDDKLETKIAVRNADNYCNNWVLDTAALGVIPKDLLEKLREKFDLSFIKEEHLKLIKDYTVDFLGLNYYSRILVKPYTTGETTLIVNNSGAKAKGTSKTIVKGWFEQAKDPNSIFTEWDTEIYPKGLYDGLLRAYKKYKIPLYVTENGIGYYEDVSVAQVNDAYRIDFMNEHINALLNAVDEGADVRGYFAWSSFDLYSWKNGCEKRYGLIAVDWKDNLRRKPKASYYWYKNVCKSNGESVVRKKL